MGKVFKVRLPVVEKIVALKLLAPDPLLAKLVGMEKLKALFIQEAMVMAGLDHPHIVSVYDFDYVDDRPFYVMDYLVNNIGTMIGETYRSERPSRPIPIDKTLKYTQQTLEGLSCLHNAGIVHRDIKPFNLLVTAWDSVKICDFGLSKLRGERFGGPANLNVGSPYYAAPEQEKDPNRAEAPADLFPVGVMFYRMLTGRLPMDDNPEHPTIPAGRLNADVDEPWDHFIARAIERDPRHRFQSAAEMLAALEELKLSWRRRKELVCVLPMEKSPAAQVPPPQHLRAFPIKIPVRRAIDAFGLDGNWRPVVYFAERFEPGEAKTVIDRSCGLCWQRSGSPLPLTYLQAKEYIERLNHDKFLGRGDWRLPTVVELATLLRPPPRAEELCLALLFDPTQRRLWSADRSAFTAAYYVDVELGFVGHQDSSAANYVRAVCSI